MVERIIEWSAQHRWAVIGATLLLALWAVDCIRKTPLDAIPDLSDPQVILFTEWMGRSPDLVEDQITYPLVRALQSTPGVRTVRGGVHVDSDAFADRRALDAVRRRATDRRRHEPAHRELGVSRRGRSVHTRRAGGRDSGAT